MATFLKGSVTLNMHLCFRNLPRANVLGVLIVTIVYLLTNISYLVVLSADGLLNSSAVAVVGNFEHSQDK